MLQKKMQLNLTIWPPNIEIMLQSSSQAEYIAEYRNRGEAIPVICRLFLTSNDTSYTAILIEFSYFGDFKPAVSRNFQGYRETHE